MPLVEVKTFIAAEPQRVFDLARDVALHVKTTERTGERLVSHDRGGSPSPNSLVELGDIVTFEAVHFGIRQCFISKIVAMDPPHEFTDEMVKGAFKSFRHRHLFLPSVAGTEMIDMLEFESPLGVLGILANFLVVEAYMRRFLTSRGKALREIAARSNEGH